MNTEPEYTRRKMYAGIGSRATPPPVLAVFAKIAGRLERRDYTLRSGAATGADTGFEMGVLKAEHKEIYLPWKGFNNSASKLHTISTRAFEMAADFHPRWNSCSSAARKFMARNCYQVLGLGLTDPVDFIICWTDGGKIVGGTGQALRIAEEYKIPVINFGSESLYYSPMEALGKLVNGEGL